MVYDWAMSRRGYQACSRKSAWAAGALFLFGLAGCEPFWNAPEGRALDFAEALVTTPAEIQKLRDIANLAPARNPEDRKSTRLNSSHSDRSRMPSSA